MPYGETRPNRGKMQIRNAVASEAIEPIRRPAKVLRAQRFVTILAILITLSACQGCSTESSLINLADWPAAAQDADSGDEVETFRNHEEIGDLKFRQWTDARQCDASWTKAFAEDDAVRKASDWTANRRDWLRERFKDIEYGKSHPDDVPQEWRASLTQSELNWLLIRLQGHHEDLVNAYRACVLDGAREMGAGLRHASASIFDAALVITHGIEDVAAICERGMYTNGELVELQCGYGDWWSHIHDHVPTDLQIAYPSDLPADMNSDLSSAYQNEGGPPFELGGHWPTYRNNRHSRSSWSYVTPRTVLLGMMEQ